MWYKKKYAILQQNPKIQHCLYQNKLLDSESLQPGFKGQVLPIKIQNIWDRCDDIKYKT
jgi:hypothetical protein